MGMETEQDLRARFRKFLVNNPKTVSCDELIQFEIDIRWDDADAKAILHDELELYKNELGGKSQS